MNVVDIVYPGVTCDPEILGDSLVAAGLSQARFSGVSSDAGDGGRPSSITVHAASDVTDGELALISGVVAAYDPVPAAKIVRYDQIDKRTEELIAEGFLFDGKVFSLSANAQRYWTGLMVGASAIAYPVVVNTLDDGATYTIPNAGTVVGVYGAAMNTVKDRLGSGTDLKSEVRAASTVEAVNAVVDDR